jgi:hypothetical protein
MCIICWREKDNEHSAQLEPFLFLHTAVGVGLRLGTVRTDKDDLRIIWIRS